MVLMVMAKRISVRGTRHKSFLSDFYMRFYYFETANGYNKAGRKRQIDYGLTIYRSRTMNVQ
jgi:hypothetical protein